MRILVTDGNDLSVTELTGALRRHRGFGTKVVSMLTVWLRVLGRLMGPEVQVSGQNQGIENE